MLKKKTVNKSKNDGSHLDHASQKSRLNRIRGQVEGIERMIEERRYCIDILQQIKAARSALAGLENVILQDHLRSCVQNAMRTTDEQNTEEKIQEIIKLLSNR